jgi:beta-lactamase class C
VRRCLQPGDCYGYQNVAFSLIGDLVFAATGDFYSHQVEKRIFHPLGMYTQHLRPRGARGERQLGAPHVRGRGGWCRCARRKPTTTCRRRPGSTPASTTWRSG